ncbi:MAG: Hint domain-containing protein [Marinibacterium sp.]|nr:Hint domain-containing protein [Marinibacterium sp.]
MNADATFLAGFAAGTEISTAGGILLVEKLKIGDIVCTMDDRQVVVKWVGRKTVSTKFGPAERFTPVKVSAGALGENLPTKDLIVTADHAPHLTTLLSSTSYMEMSRK